MIRPHATEINQSKEMHACFLLMGCYIIRNAGNSWGLKKKETWVIFFLRMGR